ncbi:replicative DNA helicase [Neobacillus niacini]|nr:replicative DNA helicase [Neobacillus niacini]
MNEKGIPVYIISLIEELGSDNIVRVSGVHYITQLEGSVPTTANFHFYEKRVKESDQKRKAIQIAGKIIKNANEEDISKTRSVGINELMSIEEYQMGEDEGNI